MPKEGKAYDLVADIVSPFVRYGDNLSEQKSTAYTVFRAHELDAGHSKIDEATKGRAGEPTYQELKRQAEKIGLLPGTLEHQLQALARTMHETDPDFYEPAIEGIREVLRDARRPAHKAQPQVRSRSRDWRW